MLDNKAAVIPVLSFPSTQLLGISVKELINSSDNQARGMQAIVSRCNIGASLNMMDLSVEAEAFGAKIHFCEDEIPTVAEGIINDISKSGEIVVPAVGVGRTKIYIEGVKKAKALISGIPVLCGVIGPYSLAGRLFDMTELMMSCFDNEEEVHVLLKKATSFLIKYINAFKAAGADGVVMAEPAAGLLSPDLCEEFSNRCVKQIIDAVSGEDFVFIYHNCGNTVPLAEGLALLGADAYHFGNAVKLEDIIEHFPQDTLVLGNLNPVLFKNADAGEVRCETRRILERCAKYKNFLLSSGCDIPADSKWENIDAFFDEIKSYYREAACK